MFLNTHHKDHVLCSHSIEAVKSEVTVVYTRGTNLPIPNMAYYINDLDIQRSGRGKEGRANQFQSWGRSLQIMFLTLCQFSKKISSYILYVLGNIQNFVLIFYVVPKLLPPMYTSKNPKLMIDIWYVT